MVTLDLTVALVAVCCGAILITLNVVIGRRQRREGNGTWGRLLRVAAIVAGLQLAPGILGLILGIAEASWIVHPHFVNLVFLLTILNVVILFSAMGPTVRFQHSKEPLPLVEEQGLLARVDELARQMGLPTPVVRLLPTAGGELQAQAFAGGLVAPSLVVGDGILHRLSPEEGDATIGHELAHLANGSLWWLMATVPIAMTAAVLVASFFGIGLALAFGFTFWMGLRHLVSRYFEYDCDRRAAEVIGFRTTFSALGKIHAANPLDDTGWLSYVIFATATHPSRAQRLASLHAAAPSDDRPTVSWSEDDLKRRTTAGWIAVLVWLASLVAIPLWSWTQPESPAPAIMLAVVGATPGLAILAAMRQATRETRRRMVERKNRRKWWLMLLAGGFTGWVFGAYRFSLSLAEFSVFDAPITPILAPFAVLIGTTILVIYCLLTLWKGVSSRIQYQVMIAMQTRIFDRVLELAEKHPKAFQKSARLRHNLGFAAAMTGRRKQAIEVLESLRVDEPGFAESVLVLAMTHLDEGRPQQALPLIEEVHERLPDDPTPRMLRANVLRELGRIDEAQECIDRALLLKPDSGNAHAVAAWIALDRGERDRVNALLRAAEEYDPATPFIEYVKAQVALAGDDADAIRAQVERAVAACDANPYALLQNQVRALADSAAVWVSALVPQFSARFVRPESRGGS